MGHLDRGAVQSSTRHFLLGPGLVLSVNKQFMDSSKKGAFFPSSHMFFSL